VYLVGVHLIGVYLMGVHLMGVVCLEAFRFFNLRVLGKRHSRCAPPHPPITPPIVLPVGGRSVTMLDVIALGLMCLPIVQLASRILHLAHEFGKASTLNFHLFSVDEISIPVLVADQAPSRL
jgi:hypothetical protein